MAFFGKLKIPIQVSVKGSSSAIASISHLTQSVTNIASIAVASKDAAVGIISVADSYVNLDAKLTDLLGTSQAADDIQKELYESSQRTGTSVLANADAFARLQMASDQTNLSAEQNVAVLEAINKSMALSGTSAEDAKGAMIQFGQALASGVLQGDELRSMMERAPGFMRLFADALGVGVGELKKMGSEGELTSDVVGEALLDISNNSALFYAEMPATAERGWQRVINAAQKLWDHINDNVGIIDFIQEKLNDAATWIDENEGTFTRWAENMFGYVEENFPILKDKALESIKGIADGFNQYWPDIKFVLENMLSFLKLIIEEIKFMQTLDVSDWLNIFTDIGSAASYWAGVASGDGAGTSTTTNNNTTTINVSGSTSRSDVTAITTESARQASRS